MRGALGVAIALAACGGSKTAPPARTAVPFDAGVSGEPGIELAIRDGDPADAVLAAVWLAIGLREPITLWVDDHGARRIVCRVRPPGRDERMSLTETGAREAHPGPTIVVVLRPDAIVITQAPGGHVDRVGPPFDLTAVVETLPATTPLFIAAEPGVGAPELIAALDPLCKRFPVMRPVLPR